MKIVIASEPRKRIWKMDLIRRKVMGRISFVYFTKSYKVVVDYISVSLYNKLMFQSDENTSDEQGSVLYALGGNKCVGEMQSNRKWKRNVGVKSLYHTRRENLMQNTTIWKDESTVSHLCSKKTKELSPWPSPGSGHHSTFRNYPRHLKLSKKKPGWLCLGPFNYTCAVFPLAFCWLCTNLSLILFLLTYSQVC